MTSPTENPLFIILQRGIQRLFHHLSEHYECPELALIPESRCFDLLAGCLGYNNFAFLEPHLIDLQDGALAWWRDQLILAAPALSDIIRIDYDAKIPTDDVATCLHWCFPLPESSKSTIILNAINEFIPEYKKELYAKWHARIFDGYDIDVIIPELILACTEEQMRKELHYFVDAVARQANPAQMAAMMEGGLFDNPVDPLSIAVDYSNVSTALILLDYQRNVLPDVIVRKMIIKGFSELVEKAVDQQLVVPTHELLRVAATHDFKGHAFIQIMDRIVDIKGCSDMLYHATKRGNGWGVYYLITRHPTLTIHANDIFPLGKNKLDILNIALEYPRVIDGGWNALLLAVLSEQHLFFGAEEKQIAHSTQLMLNEQRSPGFPLQVSAIGDFVDYLLDSKEAYSLLKLVTFLFKLKLTEQLTIVGSRLTPAMENEDYIERLKELVSQDDLDILMQCEPSLCQALASILNKNQVTQNQFFDSLLSEVTKPIPNLI